MKTIKLNDNFVLKLKTTDHYRTIAYLCRTDDKGFEKGELFSRTSKVNEMIMWAERQARILTEQV